MADLFWTFVAEGETWKRLYGGGMAYVPALDICSRRRDQEEAVGRRDSLPALDICSRKRDMEEAVGRRNGSPVLDICSRRRGQAEAGSIPWGRGSMAPYQSQKPYQLHKYLGQQLTIINVTMVVVQVHEVHMNS